MHVDGESFFVQSGMRLYTDVLASTEIGSMTGDR